MFDKLELWSIGTAAVIDTALLLALLEPRNRQWLRVPVAVLLWGAWLWHVGFFLLLLLPLGDPWTLTLQRLCLLAMCAGLLLMPSGLLHATVRLWRHGLALLARPDPRHLLAYAPLVAFFPLALTLDVRPHQLLHGVVPQLYLLWAAAVNIIASVVFLRLRGRIDALHARKFLTAMACILPAMSALHLFGLLFPSNLTLLLCALSPVVPALLFGYFVVRFHFLQLVVERSFVYGAILGGIMLFHQIAFQDLSVALPVSYRLPLVVLEAVVLVSLILGYRPLRQRLAEALPYLLGSHVAEVRERLRRLATQLSAQAGRPPLVILNWFARALRDALEVEYAAGWLIQPTEQIGIRCGDADRLTDDQVLLLYRHMQAANASLCTRRDAPNAATLECLQAAGGFLAVLKVRPTIAGLMLLGRRRRELGEEEINMILVLVEQLAVTVDNGLLHAERQAAEHRAFQKEKLSALGVLASAIAHEVKNPLSAIKAIATVLAEELGPEHANAEDVRLILGEVDRLTGATVQLLDLARPRGAAETAGRLDEVLAGTTRILGHMARQQNIDLRLHLPKDCRRCVPTLIRWRRSSSTCCRTPWRRLAREAR